jgi:tetratricopeptide (TPR) repeat protein
MNYKRENFRDLIPAPIVLWVPEYALQAIMEGAPDFWAWRSGVFEFATPQAEVEKTWLEVKPESGQLELSRMTEDEKRQRIRLLSGLLAEYEARIDADSYELSTIRLDLFNRLGGLHYFLGELGHALRFYERAQELAQKLNHQHSLAISKNNIGLIHQDRGNYDAALVEFENSLKIQEELGDLGGIASSLNQIGIIHHFSKDYDTALANYNKSIRTYEEIGDHYAVAGVVHNIGLINQERGNYEAALADFERCLQISEQVGDRRKVANLIHNIGLTHQARGDYDAALTEFEKSLKIAEELGDRVTIAASLHHIGMVYHYQGDYAAALAAYGKSLKIEEQLGNRAGTASARTQIGKLFAQSGRCLEAFENLLFSLNTFTELQSPKTAIAVSLLRDLRSVWGAENFDTAWQQATGKPVPEFLISENSN